MRYCKELIKIVDEFRHLEGFKGGLHYNKEIFLHVVGMAITEAILAAGAVAQR